MRKIFSCKFWKIILFPVLNLYVCGKQFLYLKYWRILLIQLHFTFANPTSETPQLFSHSIWNSWNFGKIFKFFWNFYFFWNFFLKFFFTLLLCRCATPDYFQCPLSRITKVIIVISMIWSCTRKIIILFIYPCINQSINS